MMRPEKRWLQRHLERQSGKCAYCLIPFENGEQGREPTLDHYVPKSRGGLNTERNTVAACRQCNRNKGSALPTTYSQWFLDDAILHQPEEESDIISNEKRRVIFAWAKDTVVQADIENSETIQAAKYLLQYESALRDAVLEVKQLNKTIRDLASTD